MTNAQPEPLGTPDEATIRALTAAADLTVTPERLPDLVARYHDLLAQVREIDRLDLSEVVPVSGFDPTWEPAS